MTRDRIINLLIAAALVAVIVWVAMHTYWIDVTVPTPPQDEAARNPYYSVEHLVRSLGVHTRKIGSLRMLPRDAVVLVNDLHDDLLHQRIESLQSWVESGGRLIVTDNTLQSSTELQDWSGITRHDLPSHFAAAGRFQMDFNPGGNCVSMAVRVMGKVNGESFSVCAPTADHSFASKRVPSWSLSDDGGVQVLRVGVGRGEFTVIGPSWILTNKTLLIHDNAQVLIAAARLQRGDDLLVLNPSRAEPLLALLWRLAAPALLFLCAAIGLLILRYVPRFGPPIPVPAPVRRSLAEQIRANARFAWRTRKLGSLRAAVRRSLDETAQRQIAGFAALNVRQRAGILAASTGIDSNAMSAALTEDAAGNANVQRAAITLLEESRRILGEPTKTTKRHPA